MLKKTKSTVIQLAHNNVQAINVKVIQLLPARFCDRWYPQIQILQTSCWSLVKRPYLVCLNAFYIVVGDQTHPCQPHCPQTVIEVEEINPGWKRLSSNHI